MDEWEGRQSARFQAIFDLLQRKIVPKIAPILREHRGSPIQLLRKAKQFEQSFPLLSERLSIGSVESLRLDDRLDAHC